MLKLHICLLFLYFWIFRNVGVFPAIRITDMMQHLFVCHQVNPSYSFYDSSFLGHFNINVFVLKRGFVTKTQSFIQKKIIFNNIIGIVQRVNVTKQQGIYLMGLIFSYIVDFQICHFETLAKGLSVFLQLPPWTVKCKFRSNYSGYAH